MTKPHTISAPPEDHTDPSPNASGGPATNVTSRTVDSSANRAGSRPGSGAIAGSSDRTQAASGGVEIPVAAPSATSSGAGAPDPSRPSATSSPAVTAAPATSTGVCPPRSTTAPSIGAATALATAYAPGT